MEELADGSLKAVFRLLSLVVRSLIWLVWELYFEIIAWYVGWPICRALSFGRYPKEAIGESEDANMFTSILVSLVGLAFLAALAVGLAQLTGGG
ncbi:hypothetical protein ACFOZ5_12545 [Marinobacter lacisalsi]|uniref:Uncharacterized protein n=1 Tax=Marinobacter lacisalsi TaxID=475979 RepID=A0ABV8QI55_9GAMM